MKRRTVDEAFVCGLLHDVGRPLLMQALADLEEARVLDDAQREELVDELHAAVGAAVAALWSMPARITEPIRHHHDPEAAREHEPGARLLRLADALASWALLGEPALEELASHPDLEPLNVYPDEMEDLVSRRDPVLELLDTAG